MKKLYFSTLKINLFFKHLLTIISFALILIGCQQEDFTPDEVTSNPIQENLPFKEGQTILGKKLENPYSVENMQKAYDKLTLEKKLKSAIKIEPTHYYVRFRPKSEKELETILRDTTLTFYSYPLDVEIKRGELIFMILQFLKKKLHGNIQLFQLITYSQKFRIRFLPSFFCSKKMVNYKN